MNLRKGSSTTRNSRSPRAQFDPEPVYATMTAVAAGEIDTYRNLEPKSMIPETRGNIEAVWDKKIKDGLGTRPPSLQKSYDMKPETPAAVDPGP